MTVKIVTFYGVEFLCLLIISAITITILNTDISTTSFSSLLLRPPSSCLIISSCNFCRDLFRSLASRFFANVCWTLNMKHITMGILKLELQTEFYFHLSIPVPGGPEFQGELWHSFTNLMHLDIKRNWDAVEWIWKENLVVVEKVLWNTQPGQESMESLHYPEKGQVSWIGVKPFTVWLQDLALFDIFPARALRALGLLLADGAPTVGGGKTFWAVSRIFLRKQL